MRLVAVPQSLTLVFLVIQVTRKVFLVPFRISSLAPCAHSFGSFTFIGRLVSRFASLYFFYSRQRAGSCIVRTMNEKAAPRLPAASIMAALHFVPFRPIQARSLRSLLVDLVDFFF